MAVVQGIKERVHHPIYDSITVDPGEQLREVENTGVLKFFVNVQGKTKLKTNLQSASLLPHYNTFEARALRVVISDMPPVFTSDLFADEAGFPVTTFDDEAIDATGTIEGEDGFDQDKAVLADLELSLKQLASLLTLSEKAEDGYVELEVDDDGVTLVCEDGVTDVDPEVIRDAGGLVWLHKSDITRMMKQIPEPQLPPLEQLHLNDGAGTLIGKLIYNTVTTFYVGEKVMIQMPTWFFPGGAGPHSDAVKHVTHGEPTPLATFRFADAIHIDRGQNFRVEIEIPDSEILKDLQRVYGPFQLWVVLDGFMTRDVQ